MRGFCFLLVLCNDIQKLFRWKAAESRAKKSTKSWYKIFLLKGILRFCIYNKKCCTFQQSRLDKLHMFLHQQLKIVKYWCSAGLPFKKGVNLVIIWGFLHFVFRKKNLWTLWCFIVRKCKENFCFLVASSIIQKNEMSCFQMNVFAYY